MKLENFLMVFLIIGLSSCVSKNTGKTVTAQQYTGTGTLFIKAIAFAEQSNVRDAVRNECHLQEKLMQFVQSYSADQYASIITDSSAVPANAQILSMEIENVSGGGGGAWSGGKMVMINGNLTQNGKLLGEFKARRVSGGGAFATFKGTCAILGRCVKTLGKDVSEWLKHPSEHAILGDM